MFRKLILFRLAFQNIRLNWRHSLATLLAILSGFVAISLFDGFMAHMKDQMEDGYTRRGMLGHVVIEKKGAKHVSLDELFKYSIPADRAEAVKTRLLQDPRIEVISRYLLFSGLVSNGRTTAVFFGFANDAKETVRIRGEKWAWNAVAGIPIDQAPDGSMVMGLGLAKRLECEFDELGGFRKDGTLEPVERPLNCTSANFQLSATTVNSQVNAISAKNVGVMDLQLREINDRFLQLPLVDAQKLLDTTEITRMSLLVKDPTEVKAVLKDVNALIEKDFPDLEAVYWLDYQTAAISRGGLEILEVFRSLFLSVIALIAAMSVANSMMKTINERIREMGTLRSLGFRQNDIILLFSFEGMFLGLFSCAAGLVANFVLSTAISNSGVTFKAGVLSAPIVLTIVPAVATWIASFTMLTLIAFVSSFIVSRRVSRMVVADALRHVA